MKLLRVLSDELTSSSTATQSDKEIDLESIARIIFFVLVVIAILVILFTVGWLINHCRTRLEKHQKTKESNQCRLPTDNAIQNDRKSIKQRGVYSISYQESCKLGDIQRTQYLNGDELDRQRGEFQRDEEIRKQVNANSGKNNCGLSQQAEEAEDQSNLKSIQYLPKNKSYYLSLEQILSVEDESLDCGQKDLIITAANSAQSNALHNQCDLTEFDSSMNKEQVKKTCLSKGILSNINNITAPFSSPSNNRYQLNKKEEFQSQNEKSKLNVESTKSKNQKQSRGSLKSQEQKYPSCKDEGNKENVMSAHKQRCLQYRNGLIYIKQSVSQVFN